MPESRAFPLRQAVMWLVAFAAVVAVAVVLVARDQAVATHAPADKVAVSGSAVEVMGPGEEVTLLTAKLRTSTPTDLLLDVSAECSIVTNVTTVGNDDQRAFGQVRVWVEVGDEGQAGEPVKVASGDPDGKVVFCNRAYRRQTTLFDDEDATIATFLSTRTANAFNWAQLNVGKGIKEIVVKAELTEEATDKAVAEAAVGKRTLIVQPAKLANDASF